MCGFGTAQKSQWGKRTPPGEVKGCCITEKQQFLNYRGKLLKQPFTAALKVGHKPGLIEFVIRAPSASHRSCQTFWAQMSTCRAARGCIWCSSVPRECWGSLSPAQKFWMCFSWVRLEREPKFQPHQAIHFLPCWLSHWAASWHRGNSLLDTPNYLETKEIHCSVWEWGIQTLWVTSGKGSDRDCRILDFQATRRKLEANLLAGAWVWLCVLTKTK